MAQREYYCCYSFIDGGSSRESLAAMNFQTGIWFEWLEHLWSNQVQLPINAADAVKGFVHTTPIFAPVKLWPTMMKILSL